MFRSTVLFRLVAISSILVAFTTLRVLPLGVEAAFPVLKANVSADMAAFWVHIVAGSLALVLGVPQFVAGLRTRRPGLHRWTGRLYALAILAGGLSGLSLALSAADRPVAAAGFGLLAILWLVTTGRAVWLASTGRIAAHRQWMVRSFALTFAAVTLRLQLPALFALGLEYPEASLIVAWSCWVPNLAFAEWWLRRGAAVARTGQPA